MELFQQASAIWKALIFPNVSLVRLNFLGLFEKETQNFVTHAWKVRVICAPNAPPFFPYCTSPFSHSNSLYGNNCALVQNKSGFIVCRFAIAVLERGHYYGTIPGMYSTLTTPSFSCGCLF